MLRQLPLLPRGREQTADTHRQAGASMASGTARGEIGYTMWLAGFEPRGRDAAAAELYGRTMPPVRS
jgi:hypothetical protein